MSVCADRGTENREKPHAQTTSAETSSSHNFYQHLHHQTRSVLFTRSPWHGCREIRFQRRTGQRVENSIQGGPNQNSVPGLSAGSVPGVCERLLRPRDLQTDRGFHVCARRVLRKLPGKSLFISSFSYCPGYIYFYHEKAVTHLSKLPVLLPSNYRH